MAFALRAGAELIEALHRAQQQQGWLSPELLAPFSGDMLPRIC